MEPSLEQCAPGTGYQHSAAISEAVERQGWDVTLMADEGASGKNINPELRRALDLLAAEPMTPPRHGGTHPPTRCSRRRCAGPDLTQRCGS